MNTGSDEDLVLEARDLGFRYPGTRGGFSAFNVRAKQGRVTALLGPNGCGKTTVFRVLAGLLKAQSGTVAILSQNVENMKPRDRAKKIALVSQRNEVPFSFTVREAILMGRYALGRSFRGPDDEDETVVEKLLHSWGMSALADRALNLLSGGEFQKMLVLRAMAQKSPVVLLDEPSNNLDPANQRQLASFIRAMAAEGRSILVVVHDVHLAASVADDVILMREGNVVAQGTRADVMRAEVLSSAFDVGFFEFQTVGQNRLVVPRY